jgi:hypothetical protein
MDLPNPTPEPPRWQKAFEHFGREARRNLQIGRYKRILSYGFDPLTEQRLREAISDLEKRISNCPVDHDGAARAQ